MKTLQCQACTSSPPIPNGWKGYEGSWKCDSCHARHTIKIDHYGDVLNITLLDRFSVGRLQCPPSIMKDIKEAVAAFNAYAPRAAAVMMRRALERSCREKGATGENLSKMIHDLHKNRSLFDAADFHMATSIRLFGNHGAHPHDDLLEDVTDKEVHRVLDLGIHLINAMFP